MEDSPEPMAARYFLLSYKNTNLIFKFHHKSANLMQNLFYFCKNVFFKALLVDVRWWEILKLIVNETFAKYIWSRNDNFKMLQKKMIKVDVSSCKNHLFSCKILSSLLHLSNLDGKTYGADLRGAWWAGCDSKKEITKQELY